MRLLSIAIGSAALLGTAAADTITLKSGRIIEGTYLGGTARTVRMEIGNDIQTLNVNEVSRLEFSRSVPAQPSVTQQPAYALNAPPRTPGIPNPSPQAVAVPQVVSVPQQTNNNSDSHNASLAELWQRRQALQNELDRQQVDQDVNKLLRERNAVNAEIVTKEAALVQRPGVSRGGGGLTELRGSVSRRREYDLWLIRNVFATVNSESQLEKIRSYCMTTVHGAEQSLDSAPETEYALRADGTVLITSGRPPKTPEQRYRESQQMQLELETGGGPVVQDCAGSLAWFGTWHNQPMPGDEKLLENAARAKADLDEIDMKLDPRLVESLPPTPR